MSEADEPTNQTVSDSPLLPWGEIGAFLVKRDWVIGVALVALALSLRVAGLTGFWLNPDEGIYYSSLTSNFAAFWQELESNAHPPLYYFLLRGMSFFGTDFVWFRSLSLVSGCLAVWGTYLLGRSVGGVLTGLMAGFLVAVSPGAIVLSQIIRPYMFQVAVLTFGLYFLGRYLRSRGGRDLWLYSSFMATALLTHYSSFLVMGGVGLVLCFWLARNRTELKRLALAHVPIALSVVAVSFHMISLLNSQLQVQAQTGWLEPHMMEDPSVVWMHLIGVMRFLFGVGYSGPTIVLLLGGLVVAIVQRRYAAWMVPMAVVILAVVGAVMEQYPFGCSHHVVYLLPIFAVPMSLPVAVGLRRGGGVATVTGLALVFLLLANETLSKLIGSGSYPYQVRNEQILRQEDVEPARRILDQARSAPGLILMQSQTFYTLIPLFRQASYGRDWREGELFQFPWGDKVVLVNRSWLMTTDVDPADPKESFQGFLQRIDTTLPQLQVMAQTDAMLVCAGWTMRLEQDVLTVDLEVPEGERVVDLSKTYQVPNISIHTIDVRKFVERNRE